MTVPASGYIYDYIPKVSTDTVGGNFYDFSNIQDITTILDTQQLTSGRWTDANSPPERFLQFVANSTPTNQYGIYVGYNQVVGLGKPSIRKELIGSAIYLYSSKKLYPDGISSSSTTYPTSVLPADTLFDVVAFRCPVNMTAYPTLTAFTWYIVNDDVYVMIDAHQVNTKMFVNMPERFTGYQIEEIETTGFTLNSTYVSQDGINFTTASYGTAVLRLYK